MEKQQATLDVHGVHMENGRIRIVAEGGQPTYPITKEAAMRIAQLLRTSNARFLSDIIDQCTTSDSEIITRSMVNAHWRKRAYTPTQKPLVFHLGLVLVSVSITTFVNCLLHGMCLSLGHYVLAYGLLMAGFLLLLWPTVGPYLKDHRRGTAVLKSNGKRLFSKEN